MIEMPSAFLTSSDDLPYADDWANTPGSTHTLKVADHNTGETDVVFVVYGAMIHYGPNGEILAVGDAESHLRDWPAALRAQGKPVPATLPIGGAMRYRGLSV